MRTRGSSFVVVIALLFAFGAALRAANVTRPIDRAQNLWRETDLAAIARNYDREGMDLLHPRIDWRGDGPGDVEMEFPLYPFSIAVLHRAFGLSEALGGRLIAWLLSIATLAIFCSMAIERLPERGAVAAVAYFALSPLVVEVSFRLLAEALMFTCYLAAVFFFVRWMERDRPRDGLIAALATALAILAKIPAAHVGLLFAWFALEKYGARAVRRPSLWTFALASLLPSVAWYGYAHRFWTLYGNSLGFSGMYHWVGLDLFTDPHLLGGLALREVVQTWLPPTVLVVAAGCWRGWKRPAVRLGLPWLAVIAVYYIITIRTTRGMWGIYYHVVSVPPVALLVGAGVEALGEWWTRSRILVYATAGCLAASFAWALWADQRLILDRTPDPLYLCAEHFASQVPKEGLLVASGTACRDAAGRPAAGNKPYMFYWLDRKGFTLCEENQSVAALRALAGRGATAFVAEAQEMEMKPGFEAEIRSAFPVLAECDDAMLVRLTP